MLPDETFFLNINELAARIKRKELSPVELAEGYLRRLEEQGPRLGAVATLMREAALRDARAAETEIRRGRYRGTLHGIPYGVKDLLATREAPTTWGAQPYREQRFDFDATVVQKLRDAGAVLVAKLAMIELAGGLGYNRADASWTGPCRTPWNTAFWSGGSSSGPGAAVSAGLVPFAIGSETSGSIITPAAFCGITGFRPTYGAVSRHGAMALCWTLDKLGPMCRTAEDCETVFAAIAGRDPADASSRDFDFGFKSRRRRPRRAGPIAVMKDSYERAQPEVRDNFLRSIEVLKRFAAVEMDVALPDFPYGPCVGTIVDAEGGAAFRELIESGRVKELANAEDRTGGYASLFVTAVDYLHAMRLRVPMRRAWNEFFKKYSLLVAPSRSTVSYPVDKNFNEAYPGITAGSPIGASNLVGVPGVSVPNGFGQNNLPTGLQIVGPAWADRDVLALAHDYQTATDWHTKRPPERP
ncbi:MAG TPA: amidase [Pyrinomonadaceae bacterium]|nr:amidase [Pyrinomonadaceae bacterium]